MWVFRIEYENENLETEYVALHYVRSKTLELIHSEEIIHPYTYLQNNYSAPHFPLFYHVEIEK